MSSKFCIGYQQELNDINYMVAHNPRCGDCGNSGAVSCKNLECEHTKWARVSIEPIDKSRARQDASGKWEYALDHLHRCQCKVSRARWALYDRQREYERSGISI